MYLNLSYQGLIPFKSRNKKVNHDLLEESLSSRACSGQIVARKCLKLLKAIHGEKFAGPKSLLLRRFGNL